MNRRGFLQTLSLSLLTAPLAAEAQERTNVHRIALLFVAPTSDRLRSYMKAHADGLKELGWVRDRNIIIEERLADTMELLPAAVAELVRLKVEAIVTGPSQFIEAARQATTTVPIVMVYGLNPVGRGFIASLARPGGNITGLAYDPTPEIAGKYVELLTELRPRPSRIAVIVDPQNNEPPYRKEAEIAAKNHGVTLQYVEVRASSDVPGAFAAITGQRAGAVIVFFGPWLWEYRQQISELAQKNRLPTVFVYREGPEAGGLMSYGPNLQESWRRAAFYVDKILKGAKPADLPVEQPTKFELVINLKTAKALGLTIPQSLLLRADQVIE